MAGPKFTTTTERLYSRLPDVFKDTDELENYTFKKYVSAVTDYLGQLDLLVARFRYRSQKELELSKRYAQPHTTYIHPDRELDAPELGSTSDLVDPRAADEQWLPWLGQLVGVKITPQMSGFEKRDSIAYASAGYRAGSKHAMEKAVRTVLSGSRYAVALPHTKVDDEGNIVAGTVWDLTILTRASESPDSYTILQQVDKPTVKPAGVKLYHRTYSASWDTIEGVLPFWQNWETRVWEEIEQAGLIYTPIPGNLVPNPSFVNDVSDWSTAGAVTMAHRAGGIDGAGELVASITGTGNKYIRSGLFTLEPNTPYSMGITYSSTVDLTIRVKSPQGVHVQHFLTATGAESRSRIQTAFLAQSMNTLLVEGFEDSAMPGWTLKSGIDDFEFDRTVFRSGGQSLKMKAGSRNYTAWERVVTVTPGQTLRFSIRARRDVAFDGTNSWSKLRIAKNDTARTHLTSFSHHAAVVSETDWTAIGGSYAVPADGSVTEIVVQVNRDGTAGTLWLDDLVIQSDALAPITGAQIEVATAYGTTNDTIALDAAVVRNATNT